MTPENRAEQMARIILKRYTTLDNYYGKDFDNLKNTILINLKEAISTAYESDLRLLIAYAGNPDPITACHHVIDKCRKMLSEK